MPDLRLYQPNERPYVEVELDGQWFGGFLHAWTRQTPGGPWFASVRTRAGGAVNRTLFVPESRVRLIEDD